MSLILASASPRRRELLSSLGLEFECVGGADLDEAGHLASFIGDWPERLRLLALAKGRSVSDSHPVSLVLSADTEVILDGECLGKPENGQQAVAMLSQLSGREHEVVTAIALQCGQTGLRLTAAETTMVSFVQLTKEMIDAYVDRCQPFDFAGGYAIQGLGAVLVKGVSGDPSNVVGLPLRLTANLVSVAGVRVL